MTIGQYRLIINGLFVLSLTIIIWINFFENYYINSIILFDAGKMNRLIETMASAYLTSFIFYLVIVVLKSNEDKKVIFPFIADYIYVTMNNCVLFCSSMRSVAGLKYIQFETGSYNRNLNIYPSENELKIICTKINPNLKINENVGIEGFSTIPHFFGIMINFIHNIDYFLKIVLEKSRFMDIKLLRILTKIQTHGYHQEMLSYEKKMIMTATHRHNNLNIFEKSFQSYFDLYLKLEKYSDKYLKKYVERDSLI